MEETPKENVYSAIYSGVPVYEVMINDIPIMRRMADSYMNATQILKIAGFSKPKRTKILESDVLQGTHEKIQGGYGKYQGTWIPLDAGKALAKKFGCDILLSPILDFNPAIDFVGMKPVTKRIPRTKTTPTEINIDEIDGTLTPVRSRAPSAATVLGTPVRDHHTQQEATPSNRISPTFGLSKRLFDEENTQRDFIESVYSRKKTKAEDSSDLENIDYNEYIHESLTEKQHAILMHLFIQDDSDHSTSLFFELVKLKTDPTKIDLNLVLDKDGGSLLHWAAACGRIRLVKLLIFHGAKVTDICGDGVTPLMKALESIRNFSLNSMDALLTLLGPSVMLADKKGRTALHYACILSRFRSKREVSTYYMECIASYLEDTRFSINSPLNHFADTADTNGDTALHISCRYKNHKNVALLVNMNASIEIENAAKETALSLSTYDFRLQQLMHRPSPFQVPEYDNYDDAPTTPMSDYTDISNCVSIPSEPDVSNSQRKGSFASISVSGLDTIKIMDIKENQASRHFFGAKLEIQELKYYKDRFDLVQKHAEKIRTSINQPPMQREFDIKETSNRNEYSQKTMMAETRLSSQLIRLDSMVKASLQDQNELLIKLDMLKRERNIKDKRYTEMLAILCHVNSEMIENIVANFDQN